MSLQHMLSFLQSEPPPDADQEAFQQFFSLNPQSSAYYLSCTLKKGDRPYDFAVNMLGQVQTRPAICSIQASYPSDYRAEASLCYEQLIIAVRNYDRHSLEVNQNRLTYLPKNVLHILTWHLQHWQIVADNPDPDTILYRLPT